MHRYFRWICTRLFSVLGLWLILGFLGLGLGLMLVLVIWLVRMSKWHFKTVNYSGKLAIYLYTMKK